MTRFADLLAKTPKDARSPQAGERLQGHTAMVVAAARELLDARGFSSLRAVGLPDSEREQERLRRIVLLGAFIHDLGKCSDHFQGMLHKTRTMPQLVRHEALSMWLCWPGQPLSDWLRPAVQSDLDYLLALLSAVGHHRKFLARALTSEGAGPSITLLVSHAQFAGTLGLGQRELSLGTPPGFSADIEIPMRGPPPLLHQYQDWQYEVRDRIPVNSDAARLLSICKALLLDSDVAGSVLSKERVALRWIKQRLVDRPSEAEMHEVVQRRLKGEPPRDFQNKVAASLAQLTLVRAGCGSGKTAAAYLWAARQHAGRQLWITYPTTGTATEGFRGYVLGLDKLNARLEHGRAEVDEEIFALRDDDEGTREQDRLDALRAWGCGVVTCTVDTVLGLVQNQRKGLYAWPGLCHGAVVFDEIHAYDDLLFGCLLRFLEALPGVPTLLMTASLQTPRLRALEQLCERVHHNALSVIDGPADLEILDRYRRLHAPDPWPAVHECLNAGGKVLWVCNTVNRCLKTADEATGRSLSPLVYHSRFCYCDRVERHGDVIDAFASPGPALAVTTQVCEMSLDLSADLLVTDLAPIPALIQRLGRLNRRITPREPGPVRPFIVLPFFGPPYAEADVLQMAQDWLTALGEKNLSQADLLDAWPQEEGVPPAAVPSEWLDGRFHAMPAPCRDASDGITILLPRHVADVKAGTLRATRVALPMNRPPGRNEIWRSWPPVRHLPVPPANLIDYDPMRGASWRKPQEQR